MDMDMVNSALECKVDLDISKLWDKMVDTVNIMMTLLNIMALTIITTATILTRTIRRITMVEAEMVDTVEETIITTTRTMDPIITNIKTSITLNMVDMVPNLTIWVTV